MECEVLALSFQQGLTELKKGKSDLETEICMRMSVEV